MVLPPCPRFLMGKHPIALCYPPRSYRVPTSPPPGGLLKRSMVRSSQKEGGLRMGLFPSPSFGAWSLGMHVSLFWVPAMQGCG